VVAVEKDPQVAEVLREQLKEVINVAIVEGDVLRVELPAFNKVISIPPYYFSSHLITWLLARSFNCAVLVLQHEFGRRLIAAKGTEDYGWLAVVTCHWAEAELLDAVPKWMFHPQPEVDSVVVRLKPWEAPPFPVKDEFFFRRLVRWLFTQRNKKLSNALGPFIRSERKVDKAEAERIASSILYGEIRVRELSPKDFGAVANALIS